jgi:hypothetical protein
VYLRVDNVSSPNRKASIEELEWLRNKRELALNEKSAAIATARKRTDRHFMNIRRKHSKPTSEPAGRFRLWTTPTFPRAPLVPRQLLKQVAVHSRLSSPFPTSFPSGNVHPVAGGVYFDGEYDGRFLYSEIHNQGLAYHERGFWWDAHVSEPKVISTPVAGLAMAGLRFGLDLYQSIGYFGLVDFHFELDGVRERRLAHTESESGFYGSSDPCPDERVAIEICDSVPALATDIAGRIRSMLCEVYWAFGWDVDSQYLDRDMEQACR